MTRIALAAVAVALVWVLVLGTAAGIPWSAPLLPKTQITLAGSDFRPVIGAAVEDGTALGVGAIASDGNALQSAPLDGVRAADLPVLNYRFEDFPRTLELLLVFRRADTPDDVQTVPLPWPGQATATMDLRAATPAWRGEIIELGFAEYATAQLVPPGIAFRPFRLLRARLTSPAWSTLPRQLRLAWFGYRPWSQAAINAVAAYDVGGASVAITLMLGGVLSFVVCALLLRWSGARLLRRAAVFAAAAWAVLDARWLVDLADKHALTATIYAGKSWQERARLQPDEDVAGFAQLARQQLAGIAPSQRILVASDSAYTLLRLIYFLLPLNAAPLDSALATSATRALPADSVVVVCGSKAWHFDEKQSALHGGAFSIAVTPVFVGGNLAVYRVRGAAG